MKLIIIFSLSLLCFFQIHAQSKEEMEIRKLDELEGQLWVKKDTATLFRLFSPQLIVNTPLNRCVTFMDILHLIRAGKIDISYSKKSIEKITFINNMAVVMGQDIVKPQGSMKNAGKTVTRRYTDVWEKTQGKWKLIIRQATIISIE